MARVDERSWQHLREFTRRVTIIRLIVMWFWLGCTVVSWVMQRCCEVLDGMVSDDEGSEKSECCVGYARETDGEGGGNSWVESQARRSALERPTESRKFYAVKHRRTLGLYFSWADCEREVIGYKGAEHKSFRNLEDAEDYLFACSAVCVGHASRLRNSRI